MTIGFLRLLGMLALCIGAPARADTALQALVDEAYKKFEAVTDGENAQYIPALAAADPEAFGIVIMTAGGEVYARGDTGQPFAIMSAAKPFTLALLLEQRGPAVVLEKIGVEPTGHPFNALEGIDSPASHPLNPMVNAGAITAVSLLQVASEDQRWPMILDYYSRFAGEPLQMMEEVMRSVSTSNYRNRALVNLLKSDGWLEADPEASLDAYNRQSCVAVTARQLAAMGATLANGGVNPISAERVLAADLVDEVLSVMLLNGLYDESGWWAFTAGVPAKTGVGGGVFAVVPGQMAIAAFSPRLSPAGNSVRGMKAVEYIVGRLGAGLFEAHAGVEPGGEDDRK